MVQLQPNQKIPSEYFIGLEHRYAELTEKGNRFYWAEKGQKMKGETLRCHKIRLTIFIRFKNTLLE